MEIIIEIGTEEQKKKIRKELLEIERILNIKKFDNLIKKIIIPKNFDKTIRSISKDKEYKSFRKEMDQYAMAKLVWENGSAVLVFQNLIFTENFDTQVRYIFYFHEVYHAISYYLMPKKNYVDLRIKELIQLMNILFDEYFANRHALAIAGKAFESKTDRFTKFIDGSRHFANSFMNENLFYKKIRKTIIKFKCHLIPISVLIRTISPLIRSASLDLIYFMSYYDNFDYLAKYFNRLKKSRFYNMKTEKLLQYFREKYKKNDLNVEDGIEVMENYVLNFGIRFEDRSEGLYCHVWFI